MEIFIQFGAAIFLVAVAYVVFRFFVRRDYMEKGKLGKFSGLLQLVVFFLHGLSSYVFIDSRFRNIQINSPLFMPALVLLIGGLLLFLMAFFYLGIVRSFGGNQTSLRNTGFYKYSRNPQIVTASVFYIGYALLWPSWTGALWVVLLWVMAHLMVLTEEEHLRNVIGEEYKQYCARTPRYIVF